MQRQDSFMIRNGNNEEDDGHYHSAKSESEEEDYESFFLQPASCPYNIKEKIVEANAQLFQDSFKDSKPIRVQFRSDLVDFEPDLTDDDVQSIESYTEEVINVSEELKYVLDAKLCDIIEEEIIEESIFETIIELNHQKQCAEEAEQIDFGVGYSTKETEEIEEVEGLEVIENVEDVDEIEELEELQYLNGNSAHGNLDDLDSIIEECPEVPVEVPSSSETEKLKNVSRSDDTTSGSLNLKSPSILQEKSKKTVKKRRLPNEINCKKHCVEELDSRLVLCINNLRLNEKISPPLCPTLRLHRQKCCSAGCKLEQKLPLYVGAHSEYGLSSAQIERLARHKRSLKLREAKERELSEAYRRRRIQQNELIFRQWLKDVSERRHAEREREKEIITRSVSRIEASRRGKKYSCSSEGSTQRGTARSARISAQEKPEKRGTQKGHERQQPDEGLGALEKQRKPAKARPKTANCITSSQLGVGEEAAVEGSAHGRRRKHVRPHARPHTTSSSTARIYIEIPERFLDDGFNLGELFIKQLNFKNGKEGKTSNLGEEKKGSRLHIIARTSPYYSDK